MKIKTELLQKMVAKAIQGSSNNSMVPITSLIGIEYLDDNLILSTTDGSNQFRVNATEVQLGITEKQSNFYTIVNADTFSKLVGKTTKEFIELENKENYLEFRGNGNYKLEIAINEEGEMVKFPEIKTFKNGKEFTLNLANLQEQIKTAKASVAKTMEIPCLTGYYIGKNIIGTDRQLVCSIENQNLEEPLLISSEMAELVLLFDSSDTITVIKEDNNLIICNHIYTIAGKELEGKENYPVEPITELLQTNYDSSIKVNKQELLNVLDRMSLFVTEYDKNGIFLNFTSNQLCIKSQKSNAIECISYIDNELAHIFECLVDIEMLKSQVETISTDIVEIYYGQEKSIKILDGNCVHIISLLDKEN